MVPKNENINLRLLFKPVQSHRTFELVCERVREKLLHGELKPGDKLPPEKDRATQLGVSRNVVREALRSLEIAGVVALRKGVKGGAFIQAGAASRITQALSDLITLNAISLKDLFEARNMILEMVIDHVFKPDCQPDFAPLEAVVAATSKASLTMTCIAKEEISRVSFSVSHLVGSSDFSIVLPLLKFGTETQRQKYLPVVASGTICSAMTEPGTGSDVSGIKTPSPLKCSFFLDIFAA